MRKIVLFLVFAIAVLNDVFLFGHDAMNLQQEEKALLETIKGYIQVDNPINEPQILEVINELTKIGSPNVVSFFLNNIKWKYRPKIIDLPEGMSADDIYAVLPGGAGRSVIDYRRDYPMVQALLNIGCMTNCTCFSKLVSLLLHLT